MNNFETQLRDIAHKTDLTPEARARVRARVVEYAEYKPLRKPFRVDYTFVYSYMYRAASVALVVALIVGGAGTASAAESALPGDALYGVKEFTETVRAQIPTNQEYKVAWDIERANRRLQEARALAARDALTPEREQYLAQQFETLTSNAETRIDTLQTTDPATAQALSVELAAGVAAHERALHVALAPAPAVAAMHKTTEESDPVEEDTQTHPIIIVLDKVRATNMHHDDTSDTQPVVASFAVVAQPTTPTAEPVAVLSVEPLKRAVARQEARLKKESKAAKEPKVQQDAEATLSAIAQVEHHIETATSESAPAQPLDSARQEKNEDIHASQNERAFLEAALYEVHDARVRVQEEGERVREGVPEVRYFENKD